MIREPCGCDWGSPCDLHEELGNLADDDRDGWTLAPSLRARLAELREWDAWLSRIGAEA